MAKARPLTWMQQQVLRQIADGEWHHVPVVATNSVIRGLISRGLIEHRKKNPDSPIAHLEWISEGKIRLTRNSQKEKG